MQLADGSSGVYCRVHEAGRTSPRRVWWRWAGTAGGLLLLAVLFIQLDPERTASLVAAMGWNLLAVVAIFGCQEFVRALALRACLPVGHRPPIRQLLRIRFMGEAVKVLTHSGPVLSEPARGWMLARHGLRGAQAYGATLAEFLANSCSAASVTVVVLAVAIQIMTLVGPLVVMSHVLLWSSAAYVLTVVLAVATRSHPIGWMLQHVGRLPRIGRRLRAEPGRVRRVEDAVLGVLRDRPTLTRLVIFEFLAQALLVLEVYWIIRSMGVAVTVPTALLVEAVTKVINLVSLLGAMEGSYAVVFAWIGLPAVVGFTVSLVKRLRSLGIAGLGLGLLAVIDRQRPAAASPSTPQP